MAQAVGSLYIDIVARTDQLEADMEKVRKAMDKAGGATAAAGHNAKAAFESFKLWNSFQGRGMTGITLDMMAFSQALMLVKQEILYVYTNIEKIKGINPEAIQSVNEFKVRLLEVRNVVDNFIAQGMAGIIRFGDVIGTAFGEALYGDQGALKVQLNALDDIRAANDPAYHDKVRAAEYKLSEMRKQHASSLKLQAGRYEELIKQAEAYETKAATHSKGTIDTLAKIDAITEATQRRAEAERLLSEMQRRIRAFSREEAVEESKSRLDEMSQLGRLNELRRLEAEQWAAVHVRIGNVTTGGAGPLGPRTAVEVEKLLQDYPKLLAYQTLLRVELAKIKPVSEEFAHAFVSGIGGMTVAVRELVTGAENSFSKLLKSMTDHIIEMFISFALINPLLNSMFGNVRGMNLLPAFFGVGARAAGGPGNGLTLVGEQGPELVNLGAGSTVIPAAQTNRMLSGGGGGNTYVIDARGADAGVEYRLRSLMLQLAGPGVVESRALGAAAATKWRGGRGAHAIS